jgi:hypothetical protein
MGLRTEAVDNLLAYVVMLEEENNRLRGKNGK